MAFMVLYVSLRDFEFQFHLDLIRPMQSEWYNSKHNTAALFVTQEKLTTLAIS